MSKKFYFLIGIGVVILIAFGIWLGNWLKSSELSPYSVVYLRTGDVYFGKLSWFPRPKLREAWLLQRAVDQQGQSQLSVVPFQSAFYAPADEIFLNSDEIVFWTKLRADSQVAQGIVNPAALNRITAPAQNQSANLPLASTSTRP